ncbi:MAG: ComF family protein [Gammaproteobacteria bacterium]|nr:ComF family protein [Gammaproteobacteria bacterium]MBU3997735.1 ComF family protein [Gammaproteobacteria bacterium]MBU4019541.1 ComF family protein [Gammaproteobacteria bacterium]MBU4079055.1 ComF family protein [Gammaproteobacteria bacterium]MBU4115004.1 ComF family protein [Gammaproteobacteria bacterium]
MFSSLLNRASRVLHRLPSQCRVCHAWPAQPVCEACVSRFAQPQPRCETCALPLPQQVRRCGACVKNPPPLDACLAAVAYAFPWSDLIVDYKFHDTPGLAQVFALLLRSTPWVEPALEAAKLVLPMPLSKQRLQTRGFNQALLLAHRLAPDKTDARLLLRIQDTPAQSTLKRAERLHSLKDAFAVDPLRVAALKGARVVIVDDVMTSGASLYCAAQVLRLAGAAHITALVIARTE